ncbi:MAG: cohesin domain-containing protein [FCB group bacterium]|jgi:hypothetical protein|nr:cohesin domain-containing protein [FCB group bacterium]
MQNFLKTRGWGAGRVGLIVLLLTAVWGPSVVAQQAPSELVAPNAASVTFDRVAPEPGRITAPQSVNKMPIAFAYTGASDGTGSGVQSVTLWMRSSANSAWSATSVTGTGAAGVLSFDGLNTDGRYYFAVRAEDYAGNKSAQPQGEGDCSVTLDRKRPTLTLVGSSTVSLNVGGTYEDAGAKAADEIDGDLTSSIVTENLVDASKAGTYFVNYRVTDKAGNAAEPLYRTVKVEGGYTLTVVQPNSGRIEANPAPGAGGLYANGTTVTLRYVPDLLAGYDEAGWSGAASDAAGSGLARVIMDADKSVSVQLARQTGTVTVDVTPEDASWKLIDGDGAARDGAGDATLASVPTGTVSITYAARENMTPPSRQEAILLKGNTVHFQGVYADYEQATLVLPKGLEGTPGDVVECMVQVSTAQSLTGFAFQLAVDGAVAQVVDAVNGSLLAGWNPVTVEKTPSGATLSGSGSSTATGGGTLVVVRLQIVDSALDGAVAALQAASLSMNDGALPSSSEDGQLIVHGPKFAWGDVNGDGRSGDSDASLLLQYVVGLIDRLPDGAEPEAANVSGETPALLGTLDASLILQRGASLISAFPSDTDADGFGPEKTAPTIPAPSTEAPRTVRFAQTVEAQQGIQFSLPVTMDDARGVLGYAVSVTYDPSVVEFLSVGRGTLVQSWLVPVVNAQPGSILVAAAGAEAAAGAGSLLVLNFRALPGSETTVPTFQLADIVLNDGTIACSMDAPVAAPVLERIAPARGAESGGSVVTIKGANLGNVTEVRFGGQPAPWFEVERNQMGIKAVTPQGTGVVDVEVVAPEGSESLPGAFTYFLPDVYLTIAPVGAVESGHVVDIPVSMNVTEKGKVSGLKFELRFDPALFAVQPDSAITLASPGGAALAAGKSVNAVLVGPGRLAVTINGAPSQTLGAGLVCTCHVLALGDANDTVGLFYVTDISAASSQNGTLSTAGGTAE